MKILGGPGPSLPHVDPPLVDVDIFFPSSSQIFFLKKE